MPYKRIITAEAVVNVSKESIESRDIISLIERVRTGDQVSFSKLVEMYTPLIMSLVFKFYDEDIVGMNKDDLHQEAVLRFYNSILSYDIEQSEVEFGLYAKICISNALVSQLRLHKKHNAEQPTESLNTVFNVKDIEDPADKILEEERVKALYSLIRKNLSPYEYRIWQLYVAGYTAKNIGAVVDADEKSVNNAIYRIRKKLRGVL